ncbi:uncharacterized protein LOC110027800 [Phalaenopsis equestris]|uniref:uncharacterized protein LOC110027800 n=1 Tax=Phalaenopsis equestris TaxID=78828 RepID=UPI0009E5B4BD|nr:uncharacterized protein LOC110027800 [Phalaenopsis equestris]XP_020585030.1 uncharacterized protein LOC110027800 [Phalaenopsis equestris]XP_020585031.1 uncharacterized protein LOC110027800 [Phalaenopsis equestris]
MFSAPSPSLSCSRHYHHLLQICAVPSSLALIPGPVRWRSYPAVTARAKFEKFDADNAQPPPPATPAEAELQQELEEDSDLPSDLEGAIRQSSQASAAFVNSGGMRGMVELLIPQLQLLDAEGAQGELWELSRIFLETLIKETGSQKVRAIFPDAGAAALLKYQWGDANFDFASLSDRRPVEEEDEVVVMLVPDYQMLEYVERIASQLSDDPPRPLIMWNPRLVSEDVGIGFNARKLRRKFLSTFTVVYSMRPLPSGAVFRCYPGLWKVFYDDVNRPNRYLLAKEQPSRPDATDIEQIFGAISNKVEDSSSLLGKARGMFTSLNRFMKAISR